MTLEGAEAHDGLHLRIAADPDAVPALLEQLEAYAEAEALSPRTSYHLALICEELAVNTATHGAAGPDGATFIAVKLHRHGGELHLHVEDDGPAFDPNSLAEPDLDASLEDRAVGGVGIHLIRTFAKMHYERVGSRNHLDLVFGDEPDRQT